QVRIDTRLYDEPPVRASGQRGRPRKYGEKWTPERLDQLPRTKTALRLYGRDQSGECVTRIAR
ncbi:MAG: hypothetical protein AAFO09_02790, partial [Pseudomonadota bacterium]